LGRFAESVHETSSGIFQPAVDVRSSATTAGRFREKTLTTLATRPDYVRSLFTFYLEQMQQAQPILFPALPLAA
jgi:hypothetical protein